MPSESASSAQPGHPRPGPAPSGRRQPAQEPSRLLTAYAVPGIGRIRPGADLGRELGAALRASGLELKDGDVLVIASKIVSKAEGAFARADSREEFERLVDAVGTHVVARRRYASGRTVSIMRTAAGTIQAAAGLDTSNLDAPSPAGAEPHAAEAGQAVLLQPEDADASAAAVRESLERLFRVRVGVIVSDTSSRPWRVGVSDIALGCAGIVPLDSQRGLPDDTGRTQSLTVRAVADEIAAAADLVKGSARGRPAAVVRGVAEAVADALPEEAGAREETAAAALTRPLADDWFRTGSAESVWVALGADHASAEIVPPSADDSEDLLARAERALAVARQGAPRTPGQRSWSVSVRGSGSLITLRPRRGPESAEAGGNRLVEAAVGLGALVERIETALAAEDLGAEAAWLWQDNGAPAGCDVRISLSPR
ncbi:coenzyme F420-0:L-glutamate ligase [Brevibacterium album]|uniref:coenzyme F420-0:L-glutamate ligase n=1 Tax=Brevibacterium album TaxID=417948 RepID=UPI0003FD72CD|nr:coenzyme F420-0:L-glutamate ligase [Brevibacterium album]